MRQVSDQHETVFPRLKEATLLASVGLYDWSSITYGAFFNTYETALKDPEHPKHAAARGINLESQEWKSTFYYTRDAYNGMRHNYGTWKHVVDAKIDGTLNAYTGRLRMALRYGTARRDMVWTPTWYSLSCVRKADTMRSPYPKQVQKVLCKLCLALVDYLPIIARISISMSPIYIILRGRNRLWH